VQVFGNHRGNVSWVERVEIERGLDGDSVGHRFRLRPHPVSCLLSP
jgi:hypothetical protein